MVIIGSDGIQDRQALYIPLIFCWLLLLLNIGQEKAKFIWPPPSSRSSTPVQNGWYRNGTPEPFIMNSMQYPNQFDVQQPQLMQMSDQDQAMMMDSMRQMSPSPTLGQRPPKPVYWNPSGPVNGHGQHPTWAPGNDPHATSHVQNTAWPPPAPAGGSMNGSNRGYFVKQSSLDRPQRRKFNFDEVMKHNTIRGIPVCYRAPPGTQHYGSMQNLNMN